MYFLSKKEPVGRTLSPVRKSLMELEFEHQDTYVKTFFTIDRVSFSHKNHIKISVVQVRVSLSLFISINANTKETSNDVTRTETQTEVGLAVSCMCNDPRGA
jgi:hypothetical protein